MNRAFLPFVKACLVVIIGLSSSVQAQGVNAAEPDPARGEALYNTGDPNRNLAACSSCHGPAGNATVVQFPKLAGQHGAYLVKQLMDFRSPQRANPVMAPIANAMTDDEMRNVAAYLDVQEQSPGAAKNKETVEFGKRIYRGGIAEKNLPACAACHGASGAGMPAQFARVGGQHQEYTIEQLVRFRSGARANSELMTTIAKRMTDDEIQAVADYMAGLR
jgi:cytochrome c553